MPQSSNGTLSPIEKVLCLQRVDVFKYATTEMLGYISSIATEIALPTRVTIFTGDEITYAMYVVVSGNGRLGKQGRKVVIVGLSQSVGTREQLDMTQRNMTPTAIDDVV